MPPKKNPKDEKPDKEALRRKAEAVQRRNRIERKRQQEIDDEIQKLMGFLPVSPVVRKLSRNDVLRMLYERALELKKEEREREKAAGASTSTSTEQKEPNDDAAEADEDEDMQIDDEAPKFEDKQPRKDGGGDGGAGSSGIPCC